MSARSIYTRTACGCGMPGVLRALGDDFDARAEALAKRRKPVRTAVGRYVGAKAPALTRKVKKVLAAQGKRIAKKAARLYASRLAKDAPPQRDVIAGILAELEVGEVGVEITGELTTSMMAAFRRAAALGTTQVGIDMTVDITKQVDEAAVAYADTRGGELIKDLAGTTEDALQALLARAVEEGMSTDELQAAVEDLGAFGEVRAEMIARTELAFAHVQGNKEGWRSSGEVIGKRSILGDLHDVEDICDDAADAGVVGLDEDFVDGASDPPYHPRCICDIVPVLSGEEDDSGDQ